MYTKNLITAISNIVCLAVIALFSISLWASNKHPLKPLAKEDPPNFLVRYQDGLLSADINDIPLGDALSKLTIESGVQIDVQESSIADLSISASFTELPLMEGVEALMEGFSYVLYRSADRLAVIMLSTTPTSGELTPIKRSQRAHAIPLPEKASHPTIETDRAKHAEVSRTNTPQNLDEFRPIELDEYISNPEQEGEEIDSFVRSQSEQEYNEAMFQRALDALDSGHTHLYEEAIDQLGTVEDFGALQALLRVASTEKDPNLRVQATEWIWQHAEDQQFRDVASVSALEQLAEESDDNVSNIARQALRDMELYEQADNDNHGDRENDL